MIDALNIPTMETPPLILSNPVLAGATGGAAMTAQALPIDLGALGAYGIPGITIALLVYFFLAERAERQAAHERERETRAEAEKKVDASTKRVEALEASIRRELLTINRETAQALQGLRDAIQEIRE
jgi:septin family protein